MLGLFSGKSDHPLADPKSARELFERLNRSDPLDAVDEVDSWLESTGADKEIKAQRRIELLFQLDDAGAFAARKLATEYLMLVGSGNKRPHKVWQAAHKFWWRLVASYWLLLDQFDADKNLREEMEASLPALQMRLLRAYHGCLKWSQFRYERPDPELWLRAGKIYLEAEKQRWLDKKLTPGDGVNTTIGAEYLRLLVFQAASMDRLQPPEIELADKLLAGFLASFSLTSQVRPENVYWVDAAKPLPPTRLARLPEISPTLRFFATANALSAIEVLGDEISASQTVPARLGLPQHFTAAMAITVLQHLAAFCAPKPPMRSHTRHRVQSTMRVAEGFQTVVAALRGDATGIEAWTVDDVSQGGMRAQLSLANHEQMGIGSLLAMCPAGGDNWLLGIVRRFNREAQGQGLVGIETLSRLPRVVTLDSGGKCEEGVLLDPTLAPGMVALLAVSQQVWGSPKPLGLRQVGDRFRLRPLEEQQRGGDYVIGRYWVETAG